jgi:DNA polymerase IV (family X)
METNRVAMDKFEIANALRETGILMQAAGANQYKARAYLVGARAIEAVNQDIGSMVKKERLTEIPGIGKGLAAVISELYLTGGSKMLQQLREELPPGIMELSQVPGLTTKRIQALHTALKIKGIDELEQACLEWRVREVKDFGPKLEQTILEGIRSYRIRKDQFRLVDVEEVAGHLMDYLKSKIKPKRMEVAGEIRRWHEVVDRIQIVAECKNVEKALDAIEEFPMVTKVEERTDDTCRVRLADGIDAELHVVDATTNGYALKLLEITGSPEHWSHIVKVAKKAGLDVGELRSFTFIEEQDVYNKIGLAFIPPELREDMGEIEQAQKSDFDDLISLDQIQGMTHCHTTYSDGRNSVLEMAQAVERMGMKFMTITDHSPAAHYAGGVEVDRLKRQWEEIDRAQEKVGIKLLKGTECDILADGELDYPDDILSQFDVIIASVHSRFRLDREQMTKRLLNCMRNKHFKIWGHPLGRLVLRRDAIDCDVEAVLDAVAESRAAIEINGDPYRLDLAPNWARLARERGIKFIISTDAHSIYDLQNLPYGIHMARRAGIRKDEVLNTWKPDDFAKFVRPALR